MDGTYSFDIDGMTCASCVARVDRVLARVAGSGSANLASETAQVPDDTPAADVAEALTAAGFAPREAEVVLEVDGMTCASCVSRIEKVLKRQPGVLSATANLAAGTATVRMLAGAQSPATLAGVVTAAGYDAHPRSNTPQVDRHDTEAATLRRDLIVAAALTLPVFVTEMGGHLFPAFHHWLHMTLGTQTILVAQFVLTALVLAFPGRVFFRRGIAALSHGAPDMNALVLIGTSAAFLFSAVITFFPFTTDTGRPVYYEAAAVIVTLILAGRLMEARAKGRAGEAIRRLMDLAPETARVERGGKVTELPLAEVRAGDILHLRPGDRVAVDGIVTAGESRIDESMLTGEPVPVAKGPGDPVTGGTVNGQGALTFRATAVGADTALAHIVAMVDAAQGARLPVQDLVNRITAWFVPVVIGAALVTVALWLALTGDPSRALIAGVAVLIVACPCAMGLAVPTSIMVGMGRAARLGVIFRRGAALQTLASVRLVAFDKTGTLTAGHPALTDAVTADGTPREVALRLAAAAEQGSEHPLGQALVRAAEAEGITLPMATAFAAHTAQGIEATVEGRRVQIGTARMLSGAGVDTAPLTADAARLADNGRTPVFMAVDGYAVALFGISDPIKPGAAHAVARLRALGLDVAMVSGDTEATAKAVARSLGIDRVIAGVLPAGKVDAIAGFRRTGAVAFVGDGINDAPALAAADVGLAIGSGTDVAIAAADLVLTKGDPGAVADAVILARATLANIRQNLFWAFAYNAALIPVAAGALYPVNGMLLSPMIAAGAMALSSVFVVSNALRLRRAGGEGAA